jgi:transcriptional regulator with XRE-family HTH domain
MFRLTQEREAKEWTRAKLGGRAEVHPATVGMIESGRYSPYPVQLRRLADALGWTGDPATLMQEVQE